MKTTEPMTAEQQARDLLERIGVENAQSFSAGNLVELANLIADNKQQRAPHTPEAPDFEQIAQTLIHEAAMVVGALQAGTDCLPARRNIDELLRLVWNARGAADIAAYQAQYRREYVEDILVEDVIQKLDR